MKYPEILECVLEGEATLTVGSDSYKVEGFQSVLRKPEIAEATPELYWMIPFAPEDQRSLGHPPDGSHAFLYQLKSEIGSEEQELLSKVSNFEPLLARADIFFNLENYTYLHRVQRDQKLTTVLETLPKVQ